MENYVTLTQYIYEAKSECIYNWRFYVDSQNPDLSDLDIFINDDKIFAASTTKDKLVVGSSVLIHRGASSVACSQIGKNRYRHECLSKNYPDHIQIQLAGSK